jgi:hypothetical protein
MAGTKPRRGSAVLVDREHLTYVRVTSPRRVCLPVAQPVPVVEAPLVPAGGVDRRWEIVPSNWHRGGGRGRVISVVMVEASRLLRRGSLHRCLHRGNVCW